MTLLHLVSEQTMQNLLPVLALKPKTIVQVRSSDVRFHQAAENLKRAVAAIRKTATYRELSPKFEEVVIAEISPGVARARSKVGEALSLWPGAVVNLTGGTKPMSIGAYLAAEYQGEPVLYCDTQMRQLLSLNKKCPLPPLPGFDEIAASLNVETVMAAHGVDQAGWKGRTPDASRLDFGERALRCRLDHAEEVLAFARQLRRDFKPLDKFLSCEKFAVRNLEPITGVQTLGVTEYLRAAVALGVVVEENNRFRFSPNLSRREFEKAVDLLEGVWLELGLYAVLSRDPRYGDPQWSLKPEKQDAAGFGETDIVCVDRKITGLALFSCKSAPPKLEHLEALRQRKETLGGRFARATLCVAHCASSEKQRLAFWCRALGVDLLTGSQITAAFAPPRKS